MAEIVFLGVKSPYENFPSGDKHILDLERLVLRNTMESVGVPIVPVEVSWPRDYLVSHKGKVHLKKERGFYADGGYVLSRPNFTMICADVSRDWDGNDIDSIDVRTAKIKSMYGENAFVFAAPDPDMDPAICPHIDLMMLPIVERKILFVDAKYLSRHKVAIDQFSSRNSLEVRQVGDNYNKRSWPCNSFIYNNGHDIYAFVEKEVPNDFTHTLADLGITVIRVPFINNCSTGGSVHCATNSVPLKYYQDNPSIVSCFDI
jgi:hypothetical protein